MLTLTHDVSMSHHYDDKDPVKAWVQKFSVKKNYYTKVVPVKNFLTCVVYCSLMLPYT